MAKKPTAGWALRRGLLVHGGDDPLALLDAMHDFKDRPARPKRRFG